jgi:hypothetical protein
MEHHEVLDTGAVVQELKDAVKNAVENSVVSRLKINL